MPKHLPQADAAGEALAKVSGGASYGTLLDSVAGMGATAHILGGAVIAKDASAGVIDSDHRVCSAIRAFECSTGQLCRRTSGSSSCHDHRHGRTCHVALVRWLTVKGSEPDPATG